MAKRKLQRFAENLTFPHVFQPKLTYPPADDGMKGKWNDTFFRNQNSIVLELGCGRGEYTVELAKKFPQKNFIGIDWKGARLWRGAKTVHEERMPNVAFLRIQIQNIESFFSQNEISEIWITFPDPQPQKTRERKRLTSEFFLNKYKNILKPDGIIHLKTDNEGFYNFTLQTLKDFNLPVHISTDNLYESSFVDEVLSIKTTYEKIFTAQGAQSRYVKFSVR
jgi:tRNA (guanine-N7-)-methyltransferase